MKLHLVSSHVKTYLDSTACDSRIKSLRIALACSLTCASLTLNTFCVFQAKAEPARRNQDQAPEVFAQNSTRAPLDSTKQLAQRNQKSDSFSKLGIAHEDSAYRYLAEKGAELFKSGRFAEAERYYRAALTNAEHDGIRDRRLAMLITNLATDLRQQQKYEESESLFERAVEVERKLSMKDNELMVYTAKQYAALLRETARDASGEALIAAAHNNFVMAPIVSADPGNDGDHDDENKATPDKPDEKLAKTDAKSQGFFKSESVPSQIASPQLSVMAELKMLADIEHGYMSQSLPPTQILPSGFSYINSAPLYSSPGFSGAYRSGFGGLAGYPVGSGWNSAGNNVGNAANSIGSGFGIGPGVGPGVGVGMHYSMHGGGIGGGMSHGGNGGHGH